MDACFCLLYKPHNCWVAFFKSVQPLWAGKSSMLKLVSAASKLQKPSDLMRSDADDESVPGDAAGWNIVSHPSVFADVFPLAAWGRSPLWKHFHPKYSALWLDNGKGHSGRGWRLWGSIRRCRRREKDSGFQRAEAKNNVWLWSCLLLSVYIYICIYSKAKVKGHYHYSTFYCLYFPSQTPSIQQVSPLLTTSCKKKKPRWDFFLERERSAVMSQRAEPLERHMWAHCLKTEQANMKGISWFVLLKRSADDILANLDLQNDFIGDKSNSLTDLEPQKSFDGKRAKNSSRWSSLKGEKKASADMLSCLLFATKASVKGVKNKTQSKLSTASGCCHVWESLCAS